MLLVNSLKNLSLKDIIPKREDEKKELDFKMFSRFSVPKDNKSLKKSNEKFDKIRKILMRYMLEKKVIVILTVFLVLICYFAGFEVGGIYLISMTMIYTLIIYYPQIKEKNDYSDLNQELPYALRHMGIELKSGKGLHDTLLTIKNSNYGSYRMNLQEFWKKSNMENRQKIPFWRCPTG